MQALLILQDSRLSLLAVASIPTRLLVNARINDGHTAHAYLCRLSMLHKICSKQRYRLEVSDSQVQDSAVRRLYFLRRGGISEWKLQALVSGLKEFEK